MRYYLLTIYHACGAVKARLLLTGEELGRVEYGAGRLRCTVRVATGAEVKARR